MVLIVKLEKSDYAPKFTKKLITKNLQNKNISNILVFTDTLYKSSNDKIIVIESLPSDRECVIKSKSIFPRQMFIWSNVNNLVSGNLSKYELLGNDSSFVMMKDGLVNFAIFDPNFFNTKYNTISDCLSKKRIDVSSEKLCQEFSIYFKKETQSIEAPSVRVSGTKYTTPPEIVDISKIDLVIVSVDYNDFLVLTLKNNLKYFSRITVVTSTSDVKCQQICESLNVKCVVTDKMYEGGDSFNKGKAINEGIKSLIEPDWILILDADIIITKKLDILKLERKTVYTSDRWICENYETFKKWEEEEISIEEVGKYEEDRGFGFFQLFNYKYLNIKGNKVYSESYENAASSDIRFLEIFDKKENITSSIHLGSVRSNWRGRKTEQFISDEKIKTYLKRGINIKSQINKNRKDNSLTFTICSYYFNFRNDIRQKNNFIRFLEQFSGYYDKMIVGLVDYGDGDLDFELPCEKLIIKGDKENKLWSKEIIINKIIDKIETDYIIWIDGDLIYEDLSWLDKIDSIVKGNDFVQLFETINYLGVNSEVLESHKSIISSGRNDIDNLLGEGYKPGGAWLGKTSILKDKKLFEEMYVGGGDTIFVYGIFGITDGWTLSKVSESNSKISENAKIWIKSLKVSKISFLDLSVKHLYHGHLSQRNYNNRYKLLSSIVEEKEILKEVKFLYMIPSYNRFEKLKKILDTIGSFENTLVIVINDGSDDVRYEELKKEKNIIYIENETNYGKIDFWKTINKLLKESKKIKFDFGVLISDDLDFVDNFEVKLNKYKSERYILSLSRQNDVDINWGFKDWIDGVFCAPYKFFEDLKFEIYKTNIIGEKSSSGVGKQMSKRLNELKWSVKYFNSILIHNDGGESVMHPIHRKNEPLLTKNINNDPVIICGLATTIERRDNLIDTINSIINQVDKLIIYQNGYKEKKDNLLNEKIEIISSLDTKIDMGDAGKFYSVSKYKNSYYFSIDDDLIYPPDYVEKTINHLTELNNQSVVSYHGKNFSKFSKSYYSDLERHNNYRCLDRVNENKIIEFPGTGVMCFHTDYFKLKFENFEYPNIADVFLGIELIKQNKNCICLKHEENWIKQRNINFDKSLYNLNKSNYRIGEIFNRRVLPKICILTTMWKRPLLTDFTFEYYKNIQYELRNEINLILISCGSEGETTRKIAEKKALPSSKIESTMKARITL